MDLDLEFNTTAAALALVLSGIFIAMVWGIPTWDNYPTSNKVAITILLPIISYFIVLWQMNK